jgi:DNA repair protein RecO (recombination protein O)
MVFTTNALILRSVDYGDYDRILTVLTAENGQISVMAKGARSQKSKLSSLSQPYIYVNLEIYRKNNMNWLRGGSVVEYFLGLHDDIVKLSLATYLADIARESTGEFVPAVDILRMTLNSYYAIARDKYPLELVKAVYEWRTAGYAGYMPDLSSCKRCHTLTNENMYLDVMNGRIICSECLNKAGKIGNHSAVYDDIKYERNILIPMGIGAIAAAQYALTAMPERMFSFNIKEDCDMQDFCRAAEAFLLNHLELNFESLNFYKTILK